LTGLHNEQERLQIVAGGVVDEALSQLHRAVGEGLLMARRNGERRGQIHRGGRYYPLKKEFVDDG